MAEEKKILTILDFSKKINKEYKTSDMFRIASIIPGYIRIKTKSIPHDWALYGGEPLGRITQDSGMYHSGKTISSGLEVAAMQELHPDKYVLYVDAEHALDIDFYCLMNNIDPNRLIVFEPEVGMSAEQIFGVLIQMLSTCDDVSYVVFDSVAALVTESDMGSDFEKDNGMRAAVAKVLHKFCREIIPILRKKQMGFKFINQARISGYMRGSGGAQIPIYSEYGGTALGFYSSVSKRFGTRKFIDEDGNELSGVKGEGAAGFRIYFNVIKNKTAPVARGGGFMTYFYETGLDYVGDLFETALKFGYIKNFGESTRTYILSNPTTGEIYTDENDKPIKGYPKALKEYLRTHTDFCDKYLEILQTAMSAKNTVNLLSDEIKAEIDLEESSISGNKSAVEIESADVCEEVTD